jgi:zinc transporter ZupT
LKKAKNKLKQKLANKIAVASGLGVSQMVLAPFVYAADPSAKGFVSSVLSDWIAPIFGLIVVAAIIKLFMNQDWMKAAITFIAGGLVFLFIKDPDSFLNTVSALAKKFGF